MEKLMFFLRKVTFVEDTVEGQGSPSNPSQDDSVDTTSVVSPSRIRGVTSPPIHYLNVSPVALFLLQHLNDEEWDKVEDCMHSSMTRSQFASLCTDISKWVSEAAKRITLPALALVLDVTITESRPSSPMPSSEESSLKSAAQTTPELIHEELLQAKLKERKGTPELLQVADASKTTPSWSSSTSLTKDSAPEACYARPETSPLGVVSAAHDIVESFMDELQSYPEPGSPSPSRSQVSPKISLSKSTSAGFDVVLSTGAESSCSLAELDVTEAPCQHLEKIRSHDSMTEYKPAFSSFSLPSEIFVKLSDEGFQKTARRAVSEVLKSSKVVQSQLGVPFLTEHMPGTVGSSVSLNIDAVVDSAASDIVEILVEDFHDLSESVQSFTPQSSTFSESTLRLPAVSVFKSLQRKLRDLFTFHPSSLPKTSECTPSSQLSSFTESWSTKTRSDSFHVDADTTITGTERVASNIVDVIMNRISQDVEQITDSKSPEEKKLELLLSTETINLMSSDLVDKVYHIIMEDSSALPVLRVAVHRIKSDSALSRPSTSGRLELAREAFSELVLAFTEKCSKQLLEECLRLLPQDLTGYAEVVSVSASESEAASSKSTERWKFGQGFTFRKTKNNPIQQLKIHDERGENVSGSRY
ncbi:hypothetical protein GN956_G17606 [Arapaima gigas]